MIFIGWKKHKTKQKTNKQTNIKKQETEKRERSNRNKDIRERKNIKEAIRLRRMGVRFRRMIDKERCFRQALL